MVDRASNTRTQPACRPFAGIEADTVELIVEDELPVARQTGRHCRGGAQVLFLAGLSRVRDWRTRHGRMADDDRLGVRGRRCRVVDLRIPHGVPADLPRNEIKDTNYRYGGRQRDTGKKQRPPTTPSRPDPVRAPFPTSPLPGLGRSRWTHLSP